MTSGCQDAGVPFDAALIAALREEIIDQLRDDWVSIGIMQNRAVEVLGRRDDLVIEALIVEALVGLVDHPDVRVVADDMSHTFTSAAELRAHVARTYWADGRTPNMGQVAWVVPREDPLDGTWRG